MPNCPNCHSDKTKKNGRTKLGYQQYKCKDCGKHWSDNPDGIGRPLQSDRPMSSAERVRKHRAKVSSLSESKAREIIRQMLESHEHLWYSQRSEDRVYRMVARKPPVAKDAIAKIVDELAQLVLQTKS